MNRERIQTLSIMVRYTPAYVHSPRNSLLASTESIPLTVDIKARAIDLTAPLNKSR